MTVLEFGYPLTHNVKARDPVGSKNSKNYRSDENYKITQSHIHTHSCNLTLTIIQSYNLAISQYLNFKFDY